MEAVSFVERGFRNAEIGIPSSLPHKLYGEYWKPRQGQSFQGATHGLPLRHATWHTLSASSPFLPPSPCFCVELAGERKKIKELYERSVATNHANVDEKKSDEFLKRCVKVATAMVTGPPTDPDWVMRQEYALRLVFLHQCQVKAPPFFFYI